MTTTERAPATPADVLAGPDPADLGGAHRLVDALLAVGLPTPLWLPSIRTDGDDLTLSLTLASVVDLDAWAEHVVTAGALADIDDGQPWPLGGRDYRVVVGRLAGLRTVLAAEIDPTTGDLPRDAITTAAVTS